MTVVLHIEDSKVGHSTVQCKIDTGANGQVMPLQVFQMLFPSRPDDKGNSVGLCEVAKKLVAYKVTDTQSLMSSTNRWNEDLGLAPIGLPIKNTKDGTLQMFHNCPYLVC